ncbi:MAG TPA: hypothetical protein VJ952_04320 [Opitutales bacterium]|nr:hypothetical protein [Opitutales bacterium]
MEGIKTTQYFEFTRQRSDRAEIKDEWILQAVNHPVEEAIQSDGRIRRWAWVEGAEKYLRVILLEDGKTIHNAFYDRRFKPKGTP